MPALSTITAVYSGLGKVAVTHNPIANLLVIQPIHQPGTINPSFVFMGSI